LDSANVHRFVAFLPFDPESKKIKELSETEGLQNPWGAFVALQIPTGVTAG
jgi:hypothetical protein